MEKTKTLQVLLLCGGGGPEHDISLISADYLFEKLKLVEGIEPHFVEIRKDGSRQTRDGRECELRRRGELVLLSTSKQSEEVISLDYAIPCLHGPPGENGQIQSVFELMGLPYFGCNPEASMTCFNKIHTKLWFDALKLPHTPYQFLSEYTDESIRQTEKLFDSWGKVFLKSSSQGSSIGCFSVTKREDIANDLKEAFNYSPYVLLEKSLVGSRELEVAVFQYDGKIIATPPGEILCPSGFYSFEEKYADDSQTETKVEAPGIDEKTVYSIQSMAKTVFEKLKLRHLSRIDFFLTPEGEVYFNEINTFPGLTPISMFPKMMENQGIKFEDFLSDTMKRQLTPSS